MSKLWLPRWGIFGCECMRHTLPRIEADMVRFKVIHDRLDMMQGAYHAGYGPSGGTHDGGGVCDCQQGGHGTTAQKIWEAHGCLCEERWPPLFAHHNHIDWVGCPHQSPSCAHQVSGARGWGWNGLYGSASRVDWSVVPQLTWQQAYKGQPAPTPTPAPHPAPPKPPPPPPPPPKPKGFLDMSRAIGPIAAPGKKISLKPDTDTWVPTDPKGGTASPGSPVTPSILVRALVEVGGLKPGEDVAVRWAVLSFPKGDHLRITRLVAFGNGRHELTYLGEIPKPAGNQQTRMRIAASTRSKTATIQLLELDGRCE